MAQQGLTMAVLEGFADQISSQLQYSLNPDYDERGMIGDDYADVTQRDYGVADVAGPEPQPRDGRRRAGGRRARQRPWH